MKRFAKTLSFCLASTALTATAFAQDRLTLSANGSTLTGTDGGGGGSLGWLHNFNPNVLLGVAGEYQKLADASWQFGSLNGSLTGGADGRKWSLYGEAHEGTGKDSARDFDYRIEAVGASLPLYRRLSLQLEDKQIDVETNHGNLPKVGLSLLWTQRLLTSLSYAHSVGGNLGTKVTTGRLDYYGSGLHFILGGAYGPANTIVLGGGTVLGLPDTSIRSPSLRQGFIGFSHAYSRAEFTMVGDYLQSDDIKKVTLTLSCVINLSNPAAKPK